MTAHTRANPVLRPETLQQMLTPQPGTGGSWGLGETLFARNDSGGYIVGHDGGSPPAWGAMMRVNPATGNGLAIVVSGGSGALNRLAHDWVHWETGATTFPARVSSYTIEQRPRGRRLSRAGSQSLGWRRGSGVPARNECRRSRRRY